jgi:hypothetical protein
MSDHILLSKTALCKLVMKKTRVMLAYLSTVHKYLGMTGTVREVWLV